MKPGRALLIVLLVLGVLLTPLAAEAQPPGKVVRIGVLTLGLAPSTPAVEAFRQGLRSTVTWRARTSPSNSASLKEGSIALGPGGRTGSPQGRRTDPPDAAHWT
jgi:hypothetical protein